MEGLKEAVVTCPLCRSPMQVADEVKHGDKVTSRRYVCFCTGQVTHYNQHAGQAGGRGT